MSGKSPTVIHLVTLPLPPSANEYWRASKGRGLVPSREALEYKRKVASCLSGFLPISGPVVCDVRIYLQRDSGDLSNRLKVLEDACEGLLYLDDKQIRGLSAWREVDPQRPRVVFRVEGARFATPAEAEEHRRKKSEASKKRRATLARNRAAKAVPMAKAAVYRPANPAR